MDGKEVLWATITTIKRFALTVEVKTGDKFIWNRPTRVV